MGSNKKRRYRLTPEHKTLTKPKIHRINYTWDKLFLALGGSPSDFSRLIAQLADKQYFKPDNEWCYVTMQFQLGSVFIVNNAHFKDETAPIEILNMAIFSRTINNTWAFTEDSYIVDMYRRGMFQPFDNVRVRGYWYKMRASHIGFYTNGFRIVAIEKIGNDGLPLFASRWPHIRYVGCISPSGEPMPDVIKYQDGRIEPIIPKVTGTQTKTKRYFDESE